MARISALNAKTLTGTRHTREGQNTKNAVVCLMCLVRILKEKIKIHQSKLEENRRLIKWQNVECLLRK